MKALIQRLVLPLLILCFPLQGDAQDNIRFPFSTQHLSTWVNELAETFSTNGLLPAIQGQEAPAEAVTPTSGTSAAPILVPNYEKNLTLFYWFMAALVILLISILVMSGVLKNFIRSDFFRERIAKFKEGNTTQFLIIGVATFMAILSGNNALSLTFNMTGETQPDLPWILIETRDLYFIAIIDFVLLGVLLYIRQMLRQFMRMVIPEKALKKAPVAKKINRILTDTVPIEEEHTILMHHEYDGIRELDNNLPPWWVWGFYASIFFAVVYLFNYHILGTSDLQIAAYNKDMIAKQKEVDAYLAKMAMNVDEKTATLLVDSDDLGKGKVLFENNCIACHLEDGSGKIGPNLTDKQWIYGYDIKEVFSTIKFGTSNGMPEHNSKLNPVQIQQVASFILSLPEKAGKEPEGEITKE